MGVNLPFSPVEADNLMLGQNESDTISDNTQAFQGNWYCIDVLQDTRFHTLNNSQNTDRTTVPNKRASATASECIIYPSGTKLLGNFTAIKLHDGAIIAYRR